MSDEWHFLETHYYWPDCAAYCRFKPYVLIKTFFHLEECLLPSSARQLVRAAIVRQAGARPGNELDHREFAYRSSSGKG